MAGKNTAAFGIYRDRISVDSAVDALRAADFRNTDISVLFPENEGTKDFAVEKQTKAPEGTTTGATSGAAIRTPRRTTATGSTSSKSSAGLRWVSRS